MKKLLLFLFVFLQIFNFVKAQETDTIPDLIISEARVDMHTRAYYELYNAGDVALDLSNFLIDCNAVGDDKLYFEPGTMLEPGETYVVSNTYETPDMGWTEIQALSDWLNYPIEYDSRFGTGELHDSISKGSQSLMVFGNSGFELWYKYSELDSMVIDCMNILKDESGNIDRGNEPVGGVIEAVNNYVLVRKAGIVQGNLGDWYTSRGVDLTDSEWILVPYSGLIPFRTVGNHGEAVVDVKSASDNVTVDMANKTITAPWGVYKGDGLIELLEFGDGMAWEYVEKAVFEDSVHTIVQTGDQLIAKALGNEMTEEVFEITVVEPTTDMKLVFPKRQLSIPDPETEPDLKISWGGSKYYVTEEMPEIDSIGNVGFATRIDTLYKYLEWSPDASVEVLWVDGNERVDLLNGDILKVTAKDGTTKEYYIDVQEMNLSDDAGLTAITWPDITFDDIMFDLRWEGDTLPGFSINAHFYTIPLKQGTTKVPALKAYKSNLNCVIEYTPAVSLSGGVGERTSVFKVTSESGLSVNEYRITFEVEVAEEDQQKWQGDPIISEYMYKLGTATEHFEIANPGNVDLDLSRYMIAGGIKSNPQAIIEGTYEWKNRYRLYVPGLKFTDDTTAWENGEKYKILEHDVTDPLVEANGGVFVITVGSTKKNKDNYDWMTGEKWDISFPDDEENKWGQTFGRQDNMLHRNPTWGYFLFRIENDSILEGTKAITDIEDFTLIDALGYEDGTKIYEMGAYDGNGKKDHRFIRKSNVWHGNTSYVISGGTSPEDSEWEVMNANENSDIISLEELYSTIGSHALDPVSVFRSTVSSLVYLVDPGFERTLTIKGVSNGETVQQFYDNIIFASDSQKVVMKTAAGAELGMADMVSEGDMLVVTSQLGTSTTTYVVSVTPLDGNTNLLAKSGSSLTISDGVVSGFDAGKTLRDIYGEVEAESELSVVNVMNADGELIPFQVLNNLGEYTDVLASSANKLQVVAQNGEMAEYQLKPNSLSSEAYVLSNVYTVNEGANDIENISGGVKVPAFLERLILADGASWRILDKAGYERTMGGIAYDDVLEVVSEDGSTTVTYRLNFENEVINTAPTVTIDVALGSELVEYTPFNVEAVVEDDGLPSGAEMTYEWSVIAGDAAEVSFGSTSDATPEVTVSTEGDYTLQVVVDDGELSTTATIDISVDNATGVEALGASLKMYPNPAKNSLKIEMNKAGFAISISDLNGKIHYRAESRERYHNVDLSDMDKGIYLVKVREGSRVVTRKLSVIR